MPLVELLDHHLGLVDQPLRVQIQNPLDLFEWDNVVTLVLMSVGGVGTQYTEHLLLLLAVQIEFLVGVFQTSITDVIDVVPNHELEDAFDPFLGLHDVLAGERLQLVVID